MTDRPLVLSLFPGIDLLGRAFEEEWPEACVVRGPDLIFGGDIRSFHPPRGIWAGIIGGPPCQIFSRMRHLNQKAGEKHGNLIPEFARVVDEARPDWFVMENVSEAPEPSVDRSVYAITSRLLNNRWLGEEQNRLRRFTFGCVNWDAVNQFTLEADCVALEHPRFAHAVCASGGLREVPIKIGGSGKVKASRRVRASDAKTEKSFAEALRLQGLPPDFLADTPFTVAGKIRVVGNGVAIPMGRAVARAVKRALGITRAA